MAADNRVGDLVKDWRNGQVAEVIAVDDEAERLTVARPSGITWDTDDKACRPATDRERKGFAFVQRAVLEAAAQCKRALP
ncbi:hypothetical protein [Streptomyces sp. NPDC047525]|uniref:hypothetical protein n=1 Tax=Streptomyces sp. NPDC047525 TaxID=3155264 RepID=UPI0033D7AFA4